MSGVTVQIILKIKNERLSKIEELFLLTIHRLKKNAYGVTIKKTIVDKTDKEYTYSLLEQLLKTGFVKKFEGEPLKEQGGRRKLFYSLTESGKLALVNTYELQRAVWEDFTVYSLDLD